MKLLVLLLLIIQSSNLYPSINKLWEKETTYWGGVNDIQFSKSSDTLFIACENYFENLTTDYVIMMDANNGDSLGILGSDISYDFIGNPSSHSSQVPLFYDNSKISIWDYYSLTLDTLLNQSNQFEIDSSKVGGILYNSPNFLDNSYKLALIANKNLGHNTGYNDSLSRPHVLVFDCSNWSLVSDIPLRSGLWAEQMRTIPGSDSVIVASVDKEYDYHFFTLVDLSGDSVVFREPVPLYNSRNSFEIDTLNKRILWNPKVFGDTIMSFNYQNRSLDTLNVGFDARTIDIKLTNNSDIIFNENENNIKVVDQNNYNTIDSINNVGNLFKIFNNKAIIGKNHKINIYIISELNSIHKETDLKIYPNPNYGEVLNVSSNRKIKKIEIYNQLGKKVFFKQNLSTTRYSIDSGNLSTGMYFLIFNEEFVLSFLRV